MPNFSDPAKTDGQIAQHLRRLAKRFQQPAVESEGFFERCRGSSKLTPFASDVSELVETDGQVAQRLRRLAHRFQ